MSAPRDPRYKETGVPWLGAIPSHWAAIPLKRLTSIVTEKAEARRFPVALENIESWTGRYVGSEGDYTGEGIAFERGDILFGKLRPYLAKAWVTIQPGEAIGDFHVLRSFDGICAQYIQRFLLSPGMISVIDGSTYGAKMPRASWEFMGSMVALRPPLEEQQAIAAFLERETAKIDALVAEQERLLVLLEEKRQAVIANAVTKGLDPSVPLKDSGIEWLGQVPAHWSVARLAHYSSIENGSTPSRNDIRYWDEGDIAWIGSGEVNQYIINEPSEYVTSLAIDECSLRVIPKGAVLVGLVGQGRTRAMSALLGINAAINQNVAAVTAGRGLAPSYLHYSLQAAYEFLRECARGGNQAALNCEIISAFRIAIPPIQEQDLIAAHLDAARDAVECLATESRRSISLLNERRAALVSAAVTGKLDVLALFPATEPALAAE